MSESKHVSGHKTLKRNTQIRDQLELLNIAIDLSDRYGVEKLERVLAIIKENPQEIEEEREKRAMCGTICGKFMCCGSMFKASLI